MSVTLLISQSAREWETTSRKIGFGFARLPPKKASLWMDGGATKRADEEETRIEVGGSATWFRRRQMDEEEDEKEMAGKRRGDMQSNRGKLNIFSNWRTREKKGERGQS